ncbi:MAG: hypothetical protein AAFR17_14830 [Pseudomonadota bacterium]
MTDLIYFSGAILGLAALAAVLVVIGKAAAECPQTAGAARLGTWVVTTGFVTLGFGVVAIIGAFLPMLLEGQANGLYIAAGAASIALGIGFWQAATTLRDILQQSKLIREAQPGA